MTLFMLEELRRFALWYLLWRLAISVLNVLPVPGEEDLSPRQALGHILATVFLPLVNLGFLYIPGESEFTAWAQKIVFVVVYIFQVLHLRANLGDILTAAEVIAGLLAVLVNPWQTPPLKLTFVQYLHLLYAPSVLVMTILYTVMAWWVLGL